MYLDNVKEERFNRTNKSAKMKKLKAMDISRWEKNPGRVKDLNTSIWKVEIIS